jgi:phosphoglycolate phosphatase
MQKAMLFDWSGTLFDNFSSFCEVYECIRKELGGAQLTPDEIRDSFEFPYMRFWQKHFPDLQKEEQDVLFEKYMQEVSKGDLHNGVQEVLSELSNAGWKLFVVSGDPLPRLEKEISSFGLSHQFEEIVGGAYEKSKEIIRILQTHKLDRAYTYYVGDTVGDIEAGKEGGVYTVGMVTGFQNATCIQEAKPDYVFQNIFELKKVFENL